VNFTAYDYTVSGTLRRNGAALAGAAVTAGVGAVSSATVTGADGAYAFYLLKNDAAVITPALSGYTFSPVILATTSLAANWTGADFSAYASAGYSVTGSIKSAGAALAGVTVTVSGGASTSTLTDSSGAYAFTLAGGQAYALTPALSGYTFTPASVSTAALYGSWAVPDIAAHAPYGVSGAVKYNGSALAGVTLTAAGGSASSATVTAADGTYAFTLNGDNSYVLTPELGGYSFTPISASTAALAGAWNVPDFTALAASGYNVTGKVRQNGAALAGVNVTVSGGASATATTASDGSYLLSLPAGNYVLKPSKTGVTFWPESYSVSSLSASLADKDFTATAQTAGSESVVVQGGENGYVEPKKAPAVIRLSAPAASGHVTVKIYTLRKARLVKTLETDVTAGMPASITWNCLNTDGEMIGSGVYLAVVNGAGYDNVKIKIGVLK